MSDILGYYLLSTLIYIIKTDFCYKGIWCNRENLYEALISAATFN